MDKYNAAKKYSLVDPLEYERERFITEAGKLIDEAEKKAVLTLITDNFINKKKLKILDLATGTGRLAFYLEKNIAGADITGVDISDNMLTRARDEAGKNNSQVKFIKGDLYKLPLAKSQFDVVAGLRFSMHLPDLDGVFRESAGVLKKRGLLIFDIFNIKSILQFRSKNSGCYQDREIINKAGKKGLDFVAKKGILLFGETVIRKFPKFLLFLLYPAINPPSFLEQISTKLILCFRKTH